MTKNFTPSPNQYAPDGVAIEQNVIDDVQVASASGAITILSGMVVITKAGVAAMTLAIPDQDGQRLTIVNTTAYAHTITTVSPGFNGVATYTVITMAAKAGDTAVLESYNGKWYVVQNSLNEARNTRNKLAITGDGAISIKNGYVVLSKGGAAAITIAAPTDVVDDGCKLEIVTLTAQAHVITSAVDGFNAKGSSGTATFTAAIGNALTLLANGGHWYAINLSGVTIG
jgi:hypothetical protein